MHEGTDHPGTSPVRGRRRRLVAAAGLGLGALLLAGWLTAFLGGNSASGRAFLRERAGKALRARVGPVEIGEAGLDLLLRARLSPVTVQGDRPGAPLLAAAKVVVRPRLASLLLGRVEPAAASLRGVRLWPEGADVGPFDLYLDLASGDAGSLQVALAGGGHLDVALRRGPDGVDARLDGALTLPDDLPAGVASRLPFQVASGRVRVQAEGRATRDGALAQGSFDVRATDLSFDGAHVGPAPIGPLALAASGRLGWNGKARRGTIEGGRVALGAGGEVAASLEGDVTLRGDPRFSLRARAAAVPWRALVEALPADLGPPPTAPPVSGAISARASLAGSVGRRDDWDLQVDLDLDDLRRSARAAGPSWLSAPFEWTPIDPGPGERPRRIAVGPGNPAFVPYAEIPQTLVRAVTASEDAGFFGHRGFDFREIASAVADRTRVRGASTISQQLAKNLFLSPERTLARKVREALGTIALEASLPKARLMEIYLNIAEWGPGVYGVGEAARFWFGKDARELTPRESAFLATVIPSPRRFHARLHRSGITPWWNARIDDVLGKMRVQNQLTDAQLEAAREERLAPLGRMHPPGPVEGDAAGAGPQEPEPPEDDGPYLSR
jgi:hypothetical protein